MAKKKYVNENAFDGLNEESLYWLGFIAGDGSVFKDRKYYCISIGLQEKDKTHLEKFKEFMKSEHKIVYDKRGGYILKINSEPIAKKLISYGIIPRKSKGFKITDNRLVNSRHFWRGLIDADGSLGVYYYRNKKRNMFSLTGCREILEQFIEYCQKILPAFHKKITLKPDGKTCAVIFNCNTATFFIKHFYENANIYLDRKKEIADKIIKTGYKDRYNGQFHPNAKLTWEQAEEIRKLYKTGYSYSKLAEMFNVNRKIITKIVNNRGYKFPETMTIENKVFYYYNNKLKEVTNNAV